MSTFRERFEERKRQHKNITTMSADAKRQTNTPEGSTFRERFEQRKARSSAVQHQKYLKAQAEMERLKNSEEYQAREKLTSVIERNTPSETQPIVLPEYKDTLNPAKGWNINKVLDGVQDEDDQAAEMNEKLAEIEDLAKQYKDKLNPVSSGFSVESLADTNHERKEGTVPEEIATALATAKERVAKNKQYLNYDLESLRQSGTIIPEIEERQKEYAQNVSDVEYLENITQAYYESVGQLPSEALRNKYGSYISASAERAARTFMDKYNFKRSDIGSYTGLMTEEEVYAYYAIYAEKGHEEAQEFYKNLEPYLKNREVDYFSDNAVKQRDIVKKWAEENNVKAAGVAYDAIMSAGAVAAETVTALPQLINNAAKGTDIPIPEPVEDFFGTIGQGLSLVNDSSDATTSRIREDIAEDSELGARAYDLALAAGEMIAAHGIGSALGGSSATAAKVISQIVSSSSAANSAIKDAEERGISHEKALFYGIAIGGIEALTESGDFGKILDRIPGSAGELLKGMLEEGGEEIAAEVFGGIADDILNDDRANFDLNVQNYVSQGMSEDEATTQAWLDAIENAAVAGAGGSILGGIFSGINVLMSNHNAQTIGEKILASDTAYEDIQSAIDDALKSGDRQLNYLAEKVKNTKYDFGELGGTFTASPVDVGRLVYGTAEYAASRKTISTGESIIKSENSFETINSMVENGLKSENKELAQLAQKVKATEYNFGELGDTFAASAEDIGLLYNLSTVNELGKKTLSSATAYDDIQTLIDTALNTKDGELVKLAKKIRKTEKNENGVKSFTASAEDVGNLVQMTGELNAGAPSVNSQNVINTPENVIDTSQIDEFDDLFGNKSVKIDNPVSIAGKDSQGNLIYKSQSGKQVVYDFESAEISDDMHDKLDYARYLDINGANAYLQLAPDEFDTGFIADFEQIYAVGKRGVAFKPLQGSSIPLEAQRLIHNSGALDLKNAAERSRKEIAEVKKRDAEYAKKEMDLKTDRVTLDELAVAAIKKAPKQLREQYKASVKVIEFISTATQTDITVTAAKADNQGEYNQANGVYDPKTNSFTFDILSGTDNVGEVTYSAMVKTAGHELTHFIQRWSSSKFIELKHSVLRFLERKLGTKQMNIEIENIIKANKDLGKSLTVEQAQDELVADSFEDVLGQVDFAETVLRTDKTLFDKIHRWVKDHVAKFKNNLAKALKGVEPQTAAGKAMADAGERASALYQQWQGAFVAALENSTSGIDANASSEVQYQARRSDKLDGYTEKEYNKRGWAFVNKVLYGRMSMDFNSKIASLRHGGHFERLSDGTYIIPTGEKEGVNNVLVFTDGKMSDPSITQVVKINLEHETDIAPIREWFVRHLQEGVGDDVVIFEIFEINAGRQIFSRYVLEDFTNAFENRRSSGKYKRSARHSQLFENGAGGLAEDSSEIRDELNPQNSARRRRNKTGFNIEAREETVAILKDYSKRLKEENAAKLSAALEEYEAVIWRYNVALEDYESAKYYKAKDGESIAEELENRNEIISYTWTALKLEEEAVKFIEQKHSEVLKKNFRQLRKSLGISSAEEVFEGRTQRLRRTVEMLDETVAEYRKRLTQAERDAIAAARSAENARFRAQRERLRRKRDEYIKRLGRFRSKVNQGLNRPNENSSVTREGIPTAKALMAACDSLEKLLRSKGVPRSAEEIIHLIRTAGTARYANSGAKMWDGVNVESVDKMTETEKAIRKELKENMKALEECYDALKDIPNASFIYDKEVADNLKSYISDLDDDFKGGPETLYYARDGINAITAIGTALLKSNKIIINGKRVDLLKLQKSLAAEAENAPLITAKLLNKFKDFLTPRTMIDLSFGANEYSAELFEIYETGERDYMRYVVDAHEALPSLMGAKREQIKQLFQQKIDFELKLNDTKGEAIVLHSYGDVASFIAATKGKDNLRHLVNSGMLIPDKKGSYVENRFSEHITESKFDGVHQGDEISDDQIDSVLKAAQNKAAHEQIEKAQKELHEQRRILTGAEMAERYVEAGQDAYNRLPKEIKLIFAEIERYFNSFAKERLDDVCLKRYGFTKTISGYYYPIHVVDSQVHGNEDAMLKVDNTIESIGSMKQRKRSKQAILLRNIVTEVERAIERDAKFCAWVIPLRSVDCVLNSNISDGDNLITLTKIVERHQNDRSGEKSNGEDGGKGGHTSQYFSNLKASISPSGNNPSTDFERVISSLHCAFVSSALSFNFSPPLKQYSAVPLVAAKTGYLGLIKGIFKTITPRKTNEGFGVIVLTKAERRYIASRSLVYKYRQGGMINADIAAIKSSKNPIVRFMNRHPMATGSGWCEWADGQVLGIQFKALQSYVRKQHPDWEGGQVDIEAGKLLDETIHELQANYTVLQRAPIQRTRSDGGRSLSTLLLTTFRSQQITLLNAQIDAFLKVRTCTNRIKAAENIGDGATAKRLKVERNAARKYMTKLEFAVLASILCNAALAVKIYLLYRRKEWGDETLRDVMIEEAVSSALTMLPGIGDLAVHLSKWFKDKEDIDYYYGDQPIELGFLSMCEQLMTEFESLLYKIKNDKLIKRNDILQLLQASSAPMSLPTRNVWKIFEAILKWFGLGDELEAWLNEEV